MTDQKQLKNVEYFIYLDSIITNDAKCTCEIKHRIVMTTTEFNTGLSWQQQNSTQDCHDNSIIQHRIVMTTAEFNNKNLFNALKIKIQKLVNLWIWSINLNSTKTWTLRESGSEIFGKFWNLVLEENGEGQLDRSCDEWRSITNSHGAKKYITWDT
jgi:hypothetical protein